MNQLIIALLSTGGAAFITAVFLGIKSLREGRLQNEESLIKRINDDARQAHEDAEFQRMRAIRAEAEREEMRRQRDAASESSAKYRRQLIENGITVNE